MQISQKTINFNRKSINKTSFWGYFSNFDITPTKIRYTPVLLKIFPIILQFTLDFLI